MKKLLILLILLPALAGAQDFRHRYFHYNQIYDATAPFSIAAATSDGADNKSVCIGGGGACTGGAANPTRGASLFVSGNESASPGVFIVGAGDIGSIQFWGGDSDSASNRLRWTIPNDTSNVNSDLVFGAASYVSSYASIRGSRADGSDDGSLCLSGGGACGNSRSASLILRGNEVTGDEGIIYLAAGATARGHIYIQTSANGNIVFQSRAQNKITIADMADADNVDLLLGTATTTQPVFTIRGQTADADDDGVLYLTAAGATGPSRGGQIELDGNEIGSSQDGRIVLAAGDDSAGGYIGFNTGNGFRSWTVPYAAAATTADLVFGLAAQATSVATIRGARADGSDDGQINICSGGACANTRGAYMTLYGAEHATGGGNVLFDLGTNGYKYEFGGGAAATAYYFLQGANANLVLGPSNPTAPIYVIRGQTADADDDGELDIASGGAYGPTRGGGIAMKGNEAASGAGSVRIMAGQVGTGIIYFNTTNADRWVVNPTSGDFANDATNGGNLVFNRAGYGLVDKTAADAAAGNNLATATLITAVVDFVTGADATKGIKFPTAPTAGQRYAIYNTANAVLKIYPGEAGDQINAAGAGVAVSVAAYAAVYCHASSAAQIWCGEMANP